MKTYMQRKKRTLLKVPQGLPVGLFMVIMMWLNVSVYAQGDQLTQARVYADTKNYEKAIPIYQKLYDQSPLDAEVYSEYLDALIANKQFKDAQQVVEQQLKNKPQDPMLYIDLGKVLLNAGKEKKGLRSV